MWSNSGARKSAPLSVDCRSPRNGSSRSSAPVRSERRPRHAKALEQIGQHHRFVAVDAPEPRADFTPATSGADYAVSPLARRDAQWLGEVWEHSRDQAWHSPQGFVLVLDEIQKVGRWSEVVKGLWDCRPGQRLSFACGHSRFGAASHAGRIEREPGRPVRARSASRTGHIRRWQMPSGSSLDEYVFFGGYPGAAIFVTRSGAMGSLCPRRAG